MNSKQSRIHLSLQRAVANLRALASDKDKKMSPALRALQKALELAVARVNATAGHKNFATKSRTGSTSSIKAARKELLVKHLRPLVRDALALLKGIPGLRESLRLPVRDASVAEYLKAARRIRRTVKPHAKAFFKADYPPDFIAQLDRAIRALDDAGRNPGATRARSSQAVTQLKIDLAAAREVVARIDARIAAEFSDDPDVRAHWRQHKRIPPRQGRPPVKRKRKDDGKDRKES